MEVGPANGGIGLGVVEFSRGRRGGGGGGGGGGRMEIGEARRWREREWSDKA